MVLESFSVSVFTKGRGLMRGIYPLQGTTILQGCGLLHRKISQKSLNILIKETERINLIRAQTQIHHLADENGIV